MEFLKENRIIFLGLLLGAIAGYLYWYYIGCISGTCSITSNPVNSTLYGAGMGGLLGSIFKKRDEIKEVES